MRGPLLVKSTLLAFLAALLVGPSTAFAAGAAGGPDTPGPYRPQPTQAHRPATANPLVAAPTCDGTFHAVGSPDKGTSTENNVLYGTTAISAGDVWAVGVYMPLGPDQTLTEHWNGTSWLIVPSVNVGTSNNDLYGVAAASSSDVWAVGVTSGKNSVATLAEHWNGSAWSVVPTPTGGGGGELFAVSVASSNDVWAVGEYTTSKNNTLIEHWNGSHWTIVPSPNAGTSNNQLFGVSAFSSTDAWAVGYYRPSPAADRHSLAEHWNGASWTIIASASQASDTQILGVAALAAGKAVGVGYARSSSGSPATPYQFGLSSDGSFGGDFSIAVPMPSSADNALLAVAVASGRVWAVGLWTQAFGNPPITLVVSADYTSGFLGQLAGGSGDNPGGGGNVLLAVTAVSHNGFWAAGWTGNTFAEQTLTELNCESHLTVVGPLSTKAAAGFGVTVTAADLGGTTMTGYGGTVHFTSSDAQATLPPDYAFVAGDSGSHTFGGVKLMSLGAQTITATDTVISDISGSAAIVVTCNGACQSPGGTPGTRGTKPAPPIPPGPRLLGRGQTAQRAASPPALTCDGSFHTVASADNGTDNVLNGIAAISANDVWAVGDGGTFGNQSLAEHWDGSAWTIVPTPVASSQLFGVAAVSSNDVWAVGEIPSVNSAGTHQPNTLALHWNGSTWTQVPTPDGPSVYPPGAPSRLLAVSAVAGNDVWAVGEWTSTRQNTLVEHWDGDTWKIVPSPDAGTSHNVLDGVSAFDSADAWAVGWYLPTSAVPQHSLAEHWNGSSWTVVPTVSQAGDTVIEGVAALGPGKAVGVGFARSTKAASQLPYQFGLSSDGTIGGNHSVPIAGTGNSSLTSVTVVSGKVWAAGYWTQTTSSPFQSLVVSADYTSGFLGQLAGGSSDNPGSNNILLGVSGVSPSAFWTAGLQGDAGALNQTLTQVSCRPHLAIAGPPSTVASTAFGLTVTAADPGGTTITGYTGTVHFTSSDPQAVLPADYTFIAGDSGTHTFAGVVLKSQGAQTIAATDTLVSDTRGSSTISVLCSGTCQSTGGAAGTRGTKPAPPVAPGQRLPRPGPRLRADIFGPAAILRR